MANELIVDNELNTGKILRLIETDDINKVPFKCGQLIVVDNAMIYYDPTIGTSINDRICFTPKQEIDVYERENDKTDEYYLALHSQPQSGDVVIIKDLIENTDKFEHTIYLYNNNLEDTNESDWVKLHGSYTASDVYFDKDMVVTTDIPGVEEQDGKKILKTAGKNIVQIFDTILSPEKLPTITNPSINLLFPQSGQYEIGTEVTPSYLIDFNSGSYEYDDDTGVTAIEYEVVSSTNIPMFGAQGAFNTFNVTDDTDFYITTNVSYSSGNVPHTAKGELYEDGQIQAGYLTIASPHIVGYVNGLYYGVNVSEKVTNENVTSAMIRNLNKTGKAYENVDVTMNVPVGTKSIIVACPVNSNGILDIFNHTANCSMREAFGQPIVVSVNGNNESSEYARDFNVWIYTPAEPYEIATTLTISRQ